MLYHGAKGDNILGILSTGVIKPNKVHEVFFSEFTPASVLMHGADSTRGAAFAIKVDVIIPERARQIRLVTPGVRDTLKVVTTEPLSARVMEMTVRTREEDDFELSRVVGEDRIRQILEQMVSTPSRVP